MNHLLMFKAKLKVAKQFSKKSWTQICNEYEHKTGIYTIISFQDLMDMVAEEYKNQFILKKELRLLRRSIHSADISGKELVIKDLAKQLDNILNKLNIKCKIKLMDLHS